MRLVSLLFVFLFLSACSVYTVTNKTDQNLQLKIAGGEIRDLKAGVCMELTEYFMGLGGDFPFGIDGYEREFSPNNYEIIKIAVSNVSPEVNPGTSVAATTNSNGSSTESAADSNTETGTTVNLEKGYKIVNGDKNLACNPDESEGEEDSDEEVSLKPICEDETKVVCHASTAKCKKGEESPVCVDKEDKELTSVTPSCTDESKKPICREKSETTTEEGMEIDTSAKAICVSGEEVQCTRGTVGCAKIKGILTALCIGQDSQSSDLSCSGTTEGVVACIKEEVKVTVQQGVFISCDQAVTPQCDGAISVCGSTTKDSIVKPYCVNRQNILWPVEVTCSDGSQPACR